MKVEPWELKPGSIVGTSSARRKALIQHYNRNVDVKNLRGNLDTRLAKLEKGIYDAILASEAGLIRLGADVEYTPLDPRLFPPAPGQGFIAVVARENSPIARKLSGVEPPQWWAVALAEKGVLEGARAGCRTPIGAYAEDLGSVVRITGVVLSPDGSHSFWASVDASREESLSAAISLGRRLSGVAREWL